MTSGVAAGPRIVAPRVARRATSPAAMAVTPSRRVSPAMTRSSATTLAASRRVATVVAAARGDACDARRERVESLEAPVVALDENASTTSDHPILSKILKAAALAAVACAVTALVFPDIALAAAKKAVVAASSEPMWKKAIGWVLHLDKHLAGMFASYGTIAYAILFAIVFCETGLVVTPFLPGDSLLFATGALGASGALNFPLTMAMLFSAAVLGDAVNYGVGNWAGANFMVKYPKVFKKEYVEKTKKFYEKYGGKTVVMARFFPIVRTFAPFVAGVANMTYATFFTYNVMGAAVWICSFMSMGYFFGQIPAVQENFALTVIGIIVLSLVPVIVEIINAKKEESESESEGGEAAAAQ